MQDTNQRLLIVLGESLYHAARSRLMETLDRNLFGRDWLSKNPEGTVAQFQAALASVDRTKEFAVCLIS